MEELGIKPKRLAGASAGAITCAMIAVGYTADEMMEYMSMDLQAILLGRVAWHYIYVAYSSLPSHRSLRHQF